MFMPNISFRDALDTKIGSQNQFGHSITIRTDKATRSATVFGNKIHMHITAWEAPGPFKTLGNDSKKYLVTATSLFNRFVLLFQYVLHKYVYILTQKEIFQNMHLMLQIYHSSCWVSLFLVIF